MMLIKTKPIVTLKNLLIYDIKYMFKDDMDTDIESTDEVDNKYEDSVEVDNNIEDSVEVK